MKKTIIIIIFLIFTAFSYSITLKIGIFDEKPFYYRENNTYKGFVVDILKDIAKKEGWKLEFIYGTREEILKKVENDEIDLAPFFVFDEKNSNYITNKEPLYSQWIGMIAEKEFDLKKLKEKTFVIKKGSGGIQLDKIFEKISKKVLIVSSFEEKLKELKDKKADIAIIDADDLENIIDIQGYYVYYYPLEIYFNISRKLNKDMVDKLDKYIKEYKSDKNSIYYEALSKKIFGVKYIIPLWILNVFILFLILFFTVSISLYIFRKKYKKTMKNLIKQKEKYEKLSKENKHQYNILSKIVNIITEVILKEQNIKKFGNRILKESIEVIPEGKYGSVILAKNNIINYLSAIGHDIKILRKIHIVNNDFYFNIERLPNIKIIKNILSIPKDEIQEQFKKAAKPIKSTMMYINKIIDDLYFGIFIDNDKDEDFSEEAKKLMEMIGNLATVYFKYKIAFGKAEYEKIKAKKANEAKTMFLSNMSHDIRTPINGIVGMTYILEKTKLDDTQRKYLKMLKNSAYILTDLINDILDLSKLEANEMIIEKRKFNLEKEMEKAIDANIIESYKKGLELNYYIGDDVPKELIGDSIKLKQILNNLISNAIKFTSKGEVNIFISLEKNKKTPIILFKVIDTGIGIKKENRKRIFKPFIQENITISRKYGGTGLGLSIVKKLVDLLGGEIKITSKVDEGTTFYIGIPFEISENSKQYNDSESIDFSLKNVLIIDDNETNRFIMRKYLEKLNLNIEEVVNGVEALKKLKEKKYDLLLIDKNMPIMDGIEFTEKINEIKELKGIKKILLSSTLDNLMEITKLNYDAIIPKPIKREVLIESIISIFRNDILKLKKLEKIEKNKIIENMKVLLVDDNEINREVGKVILENFNIIVDLAESGEEAIEKIKISKYDIIFMDIQMPVMDGYETTRIIRELNKDTPIIAMTAHAMSQYKEKALKIGMNDFITKPISPDMIYEKIKEYCLIKKENTKTNGKNKASNGIKGIHFDKKEYLKRVLNKKELAEKILKKYLIDLKENIEKLEESINKNDKEKIRFYAHTIKGSSKNVSANKMGKLAEKIEYEYSGYKDFEEIKKEYYLLKEEIGNFLRSELNGKDIDS